MHSVWLDHLGTMQKKIKQWDFVVYQNVAIATNYLVKKYKYKKIAILDFDVHWGQWNTMMSFLNNKNSLYISTHQYPFYPGTGTDKDKGDFNNIYNIPLARWDKL